MTVFNESSKDNHVVSKDTRAVWLTRLCSGLLAFLFALLIFILFKDDLNCFFAMFGIESKARLIEIVGIAIAGNILLIQATVSYRRAVALERSVENQVEANNVLDRGNRQERLNGAIDHLGSESTTVRLSAGYELLDLAASYKDLRYSIFSILCARIRESTTKSVYREQYKHCPSEEIQSLLNILFVDGKNLFEDLSADLSHCWFRGADFSHAFLENAKLDEANFDHAKLYDAQFRNCSFFRTRLRKILCFKTMLQNSDFDFADLRDSRLSGMMQGVSLSHAKLDGADLSHTKLQGACLTHASIKGANLTSTCFHGAILKGAKLQGAFLGSVQFQGADLNSCDMRGVFSDEAPDSLFFRDHMIDRCGCQSDFKTVRFKGGLTQGDLGDAIKHLSEHRKKDLKDLLSPQIGPSQKIDPEVEFNVVIGEFTREEAERWITAHDSSTGFSPH